MLCPHSLSRQETPNQHSAPVCGHLAKTSRPSANSWHLGSPGLTGSWSLEGWDQALGRDKAESVGAHEGVDARKAEGCKGADEIEEKGKEVQGEGRNGGETTWQGVSDSGSDVGEETWNSREDKEGAKKDQGPSKKGQEGEKVTRGTEARGSRRGRSGDKGMGKTSGCRKDEPGEEGSGKEVREDQGPPGVKLQWLKENLGGSKEPGVSKAGTRSKRLGQGPSLRLSSYTWSLGRGYKIIGYPSPARAPIYTLTGALELRASGVAPPVQERQQAPE